MKNTLEELFQPKRQKSKTLVSVKPGSYMLLHTNKMKRVLEEAQGLLVGDRIKDDNHKIVLVDEDLILIPSRAFEKIGP